jgi:hypothetical protein
VTAEPVPAGRVRSRAPSPTWHSLALRSFGSTDTDELTGKALVDLGRACSRSADPLVAEDRSAAGVRDRTGRNIPRVGELGATSGRWANDGQRTTMVSTVTIATGRQARSVVHRAQENARRAFTGRGHGHSDQPAALRAVRSPIAEA